MKIIANTYFQKILKLAIVGTILYFILIRIDHTELRSFKLSYTEIVLLLIFSIANWYFEIIKWKTLANHIQKTTLSDSLRQSLSAHALAFITPNRIGEYGAKAIYFKNKKQTLALTFISNSYQLLTTLFFGVFGLTILSFRYSETIFHGKTILVFGILVTLFTVGLYYFNNKFLKFIKFYKEISKSVHFKAVLFSVLKYLVFSHQLFILLVFFNIGISYSIAIPLIFSMYLLASIIPSLALFDFVIKGGAAIFLFGLESISATTITTIIFTTWVFNFAIPAIIGSTYIIRFKPNYSYDTN